MASLSEEQRRRIEENRKKALAIRAAKLSTATSSNSPVSSSRPLSAIKPNVPYNSYPNPPNGGVNVNASTSSISSNKSYDSSNSTSEVNKFAQNSSCPSTNQFSTEFKNTSSNAVQNTSAIIPHSNKTTKTNKLSILFENSNLSKPCYNKFNKYSKPSTEEGGSSVAKFYGKSESVARISVNFSLISSTRFTVEFNFHEIIVNVLKTIPGKLYDPGSFRWSFPLSSYYTCINKLQNIKELSVTTIPLPKFILKVFVQNPRPSTDYKSIDLSKIDYTLLSSLFPFQKEGVQFGVSKNGRCIIADDMGLGKTIQALGIAHYYYSDWPLLIMCPSSMRYQWEEEIRNNIPDIPVTRIFVQTKSKEQIHNPLILITSYDLMAKCEAQLKTMKFGVVIADESHSMKSLKAKRTKSALSLISETKRCILLSGTPALSRPYELFPQIKAIEPHAFSGKEFGLRYCDGKEGRFGWDYTGSSNMDELKVLLEERFMIRRLKCTVLNQLPSKIRQVVILDKDSIKAETKTMSDLAVKLSNEKLKGSEKHSTLLSYFAETAKIKLKAIKDYICQILETGVKFLVFAHHKEVLDEISKLLEEKETYFIRIDGSVKSDERKSVCDQFQYEDKFRVAVLSITAASTGLTLTAANLVIFAELFWNPGILTQAEDRVHRIGQLDSVLVQYLLASGTADDHIWPLVKSKLDTLNKAGLSKDNFTCERTTMVTNDGNSKIDDYFREIQDSDDDLCQLVDEIEENECKRIKLS